MSHFVLVDCNNFYVSCERLFNPKLEGKPVIVLSNNDGCVISRSEEAKTVGIKMGEPYFLIKNLCLHRNVHVYSSNYPLYGDISERVMNLLSEMAPEFQINSIDEAFLKYPASMSPDEVFSICCEIKRKAKQWIGVPFSFGIGPSKTLTKVAIDFAKKTSIGVFNISEEIRIPILKKYPIQDVWGIGRQLCARLHSIEIYTADDYCQLDANNVRKKMGVVGERLWWELHGTSCLDFAEPAAKKSISTSRSFSKLITEEGELAEALSTFVATACVSLRQQNSSTQAICVFIEAQIEPQQKARRCSSMIENFSVPTHITSEIIQAAKKCLRKMFKEGDRYKKCGVILLDICEESSIMPDLFAPIMDSKKKHLIKCVDSYNKKFGKNTIFFGAMGVKSEWKSQKNFISKVDPNQWNSLPIAKCV
jgi:DNA polymerase V